MTEQRNKTVPRLFGAAMLLLFAVLLVFRLGIPEKIRGRPSESSPIEHALASEDIWLEIRQQGIKTGYVHRKRDASPQGTAFVEDIFMRINTMGTTQPLTIKTSASFDPRGRIERFHFLIGSQLFPFEAQGTAEGGKMHVRIGNEQKTIDLPPNACLGADAAAAAGLARLVPGEKKTLVLFDPATLASRSVAVEALGEDVLTIMGERTVARKLAFDLGGLRQLAWVSPDGAVLREEGALGLTLQRVSMREAQSGIVKDDLPDLTEAASIAVSTPIDNPSTIRKLVLRLHDLPEGLFMLDGDRQTFERGILTIRLENFLQKKDRPRPENPHAFLEATPFIQSKNRSILQKVSEIVAKEDSGRGKAEKLVSWAYRNIAKKPVISVPDALRTLKTGEGDCNEHAALLAAMSRAAGLPAQIETGLVFMRGRFFFHAWNVLYIDEYGGWVTADAALGQFPADATHIRLARGELDHQVDLAGLMGRLKIDIVRMEP